MLWCDRMPHRVHTARGSLFLIEGSALWIQILAAVGSLAAYFAYLHSKPHAAMSRYAIALLAINLVFLIYTCILGICLRSYFRGARNT